MKLEFDSYTITLSCPGCGKKFDETIGRVKNNQSVTCPACGGAITVDANQMREIVETIQKNFNSIG